MNTIPEKHISCDHGKEQKETSRLFLNLKVLGKAKKNTKENDFLMFGFTAKNIKENQI